MADVVKIVDSIAASPTVRLDLNGEGSNGWYTRVFKAPPPRLRRSVSQNAMRDGANVSSSQYDARVITLDLELIKTGAGAQDASATELQKLARELDRVDNFLMYQPSGLTKPVFFRLFRSDFSDLEDVIAQNAMRRFTVELLAEPFALGLRERLVTAQPVANDNTDGGYFTGGVVLGDVPTPAVISFTEAVTQPIWIASGGAGGFPMGYAAEGGTNGTDTSSVVGDATYANSAGKLVSFATTTAMATRVSGISGPTPSLGLCRVWMRCKKSVAGDSINVRVKSSTLGPIAVPTEAAPVSLATTAFQMVDLGLVELPAGGSAGVGHDQDDLAPFDLFIDAERASGSGSLGIDYVTLVPVKQSCVVSGLADPAPGSVVLDGVNDDVLIVSHTDPFNASSDITTTAAVERSGALPLLYPDPASSAITFLRLEAAALTDTTTLTVDYWPRYLYVRPSAS